MAQRRHRCNPKVKQARTEHGPHLVASRCPSYHGRMSGSGAAGNLDTDGFGDPEDEAEGSSLPLLAVGAATPLLVFMLAAAVLFGIRLPARGAGVAQPAHPTVVISLQAQRLPPTPTPFVLRPHAPPILSVVVPLAGSAEADVATLPACVALRTGRAPNGGRLGDGLLDLIAHAHPECP
jgi:hypothetical protein